MWTLGIRAVALACNQLYAVNFVVDRVAERSVRLIWPREMRSEIQQLSVENQFAESQDLHSVQFIYIKCHITQIHDVTCHRDGAYISSKLYLD